ncbi:MAG: PAS domain-containing protein [Spirochaetes bacterium]|nr:PAS domain-containing protein [Spirochaetota bacterium]
MFIIDAEDSLVLEANNHALRLFGYPKEEFLRLREADLMAPARDPGIGDGPGPAMNCRRKDGSTFPAETEVAGTSVGGRPVCVRSVRDVTYKKEAENRLLLNLAERKSCSGKSTTASRTTSSSSSACSPCSRTTSRTKPRRSRSRTRWTASR